MESSVAGGHSADNSMENDPDDDEDLMPPPTPGTLILFHLFCYQSSATQNNVAVMGLSMCFVKFHGSKTLNLNVEFVSGPFNSSSSAPKDGDIVKPTADGKAPDAPDGFTVITKDNGLMILRKKRYRDLKKVGIGGFQAKTRMPSRKGGKDDPNCDADDKTAKKRAAWKPKKNKLLAQYPEYIQVH